MAMLGCFEVRLINATCKSIDESNREASAAPSSGTALSALLADHKAVHAHRVREISAHRRRQSLCSAKRFGNAWESPHESWRPMIENIVQKLMSVFCMAVEVYVENCTAKTFTSFW
jgi:hypothetical protein